MRLLWQPQARQDLLQVYETIARDSPVGAERVLATLQSNITLLLEFPRLGAACGQIRPAMRVLIVRRYLVLYELLPDVAEAPVEAVTIVRVVDGRRDLPRLFQVGDA